MTSQYFDFSGLIGKYSTTFVLETIDNGYYDESGDWTLPSSVKIERQGAIIAISERKIYRSNGVLTEQDKELYTTESLGDIEQSKVFYDGDVYNVESNPNNNAQFTGVWQYTLKWVSAFGGDAK